MTHYIMDKQQTLKHKQMDKEGEKLQQKKIHYLLQTDSALLHPYCRRYVQEYHSWFDLYPDLLYLTGSEPLTLQEEYQNHQSWIQDPSKYTFIIFAQDGKMIGDVNLFFSEWIQPNEAQINIMIAVPEYRGKGIAREVMDVIEKFAKAVYRKDLIIAKIKDDNTASVNFFQKIGYDFICHNTNFGQKQFRKKVCESCEQLTKQLIEKNKLRENQSMANLFEE